VGQTSRNNHQNPRFQILKLLNEDSHKGLNGHLLGWKPCKLLNAIALGQIKAMNKKTAFTAGLK